MRSGFILVGAILLGLIPTMRADVLYSVTELGTLGGTSTVAYAINDAGQVTGQSAGHAFLYSGGQMIDLGTLSAPFRDTSVGAAINNQAQVAGSAFTPATPVPSSHAFLYSGGQTMDLGTLGGGQSNAYGINDAGQVVGGATAATFLLLPHPFLYSNGQMTDLGRLTGSGLLYGSGYGINNAGQVTGQIYTSDLRFLHAFLYSNGQLMDLGTLGGDSSAGYAINATGQVTGSASTSAGFTHAFLYSAGQMTDLGSLGGDFTNNDGVFYSAFSIGRSVNDAGQVTGSFGTSDKGPRAFVYRDGQMFDLNNLIDPGLGVTLFEARGINDKGQVVANSLTTNRAYLLTPVPEPSTVALFGLALLGLAASSPLRRSVIHKRAS